MTEEKVVSKEGSLDTDAIIELDEHNPVGPITTEPAKQRVTISNIRVPPIRRILKSSQPTITITIETEENTKTRMKLVLDRFADGSSDKTSVDTFCSKLQIDKDQLYALLDREIPLKISRTGSDYQIRMPNKKLDIELEDVETDNRNFNQLRELWKAQEYGKARITGLETTRGKGTFILIEVPWLNVTQKIRFSTTVDPDSRYPYFPAFYRSLIGRYPMNKDEMTSVIGEEIDISYKGRIGLDEQIIRDIENNRRTLTEYIKDNKQAFMKLASKNFFYISVICLAPSILLNLLFGPTVTPLLLFLWIFTVVSVLLLSSVISLLEAQSAYTDTQPLSDYL